MNQLFFHFHSVNLEHFLITLTTKFWTKVYFYQANSRFHRLLLVLFQEPAQDFLKKTARSTREIINQQQTTKKDMYFYNTVSKNIKRQENQHYQLLQFLT